MANNKRKRRSPVNSDLYSICATRTVLELGCTNCVARDIECKRFKAGHHGSTPYDIHNYYLANESEENEND